MRYSKFLLILALVAFSSARSIHRTELRDRYLAGLGYSKNLHPYRDPYETRDYDFGYKVNDHHTGDYKSHKETRKGNVVKGSYQLLDPDGYQRIVDYTADDIHGFNAIVRRIPFYSQVSSATPDFFGLPFATVAPIQDYAQADYHLFNPHVTKLLPISSHNPFDFSSGYFHGSHFY